MFFLEQKIKAHLYYSRGSEVDVCSRLLSTAKQTLQSILLLLLLGSSVGSDSLQPSVQGIL